jgi:hypothetical protein
VGRAAGGGEGAGGGGGGGGEDGEDPFSQTGLGLELEELERERRGDESSISLGVSEALPRRTPLQPAAPPSAAKGEGGALSAVSGGASSGQRKAVQWVGVSPGADGGGALSPFAGGAGLLSPPPARRGGGDGAPAPSAAADAALDALVFLEEQRCAAEEVGDSLVAFLLLAAWELRAELRGAVGGAEAGGVARALLLQAGGEGVEAVLDALPESLPGGWGALRRAAAAGGAGGADGAAVAAFASAAAGALGAGWDAGGAALLPTLHALLRRTRAHLAATALALGPQGAFSAEALVEGGAGGGGVGAAARLLLEKGEAPGAGAGGGGGGARISRADYVAALLRREAGKGQGGNAYVLAPLPAAAPAPPSPSGVGGGGARRAPPLALGASPLRKLQGSPAATAAAAQLLGKA